MERPNNWKYGVIQNHQPQLRPLLHALKRLRGEGLTSALVLSAVHHRRVLLLISRPLRMGEMSPHALSRDLEVCQMSNEALPDEEVAARVMAAVSGDFEPDSVNSFPMKPDNGYFDLVSPSSCDLSILIFSSIFSCLILLRFGIFFAGGDRRKVLEAPGERG